MARRRHRRKITRRRTRRSSKDDNAALVIIALVLLGVLSAAFIHVMLMLAALVIAGFVIRWIVKGNNQKRIRDALLAAGTTDPMQLNPVQYEKFCAALLENNGWITQPTRTTGDFGADVVAKKGKRVLIVQCKQYTGNVGVKAVQEVYTAVPHYGGTQAIVVSTAGYTKAATELAGSTGVKLMSHTDLIDYV